MEAYDASPHPLYLYARKISTHTAQITFQSWGRAAGPFTQSKSQRINYKTSCIECVHTRVRVCCIASSTKGYASAKE
jgi:hypothetical protein